MWSCEALSGEAHNFGSYAGQLYLWEGYGYRPVELNASDERSTEAFQTALQSATLMRSVLDADRRPNCLILDEIDGAPIQTVELLVKWCTAAASKKEDGKKKTKAQPLKRPVIAICNDLYATSLRPLR
ncbi:jg18086 [Pararge aegeria aegeria]|uniref:Jg18086 protein n=1 Tax=Pararge aegeria aegeria TaxID=348720 RepID=A0A8S4RSQ2_9NEOP|nr:jg18086 [Pararge aegeria aegeria]